MKRLGRHVDSIAKKIKSTPMSMGKDYARLLFLTFILIFSFSPIVFCQEKEESFALSLFQQKVASFKGFLSGQPKLLYKQSFSESPTGVVYEHHQVRLLNISYDVRRTDSLVSPFLGIIDVTYEDKTNRSCGDVKTTFGRKTWVNGFSSREKILKYRDRCFKLDDVLSTEHVRFSFAFQEDRWTWKNVIRVKYNNPDLAISAALGKPIAPGLRVEDNKQWEELVK